jgi:hypothetical protein
MSCEASSEGMIRIRRKEWTSQHERNKGTHENKGHEAPLLLSGR